MPEIKLQSKIFYSSTVTKAILQKHTSHVKSWQNRKDIYVAYMRANAVKARLFYIYTHLHSIFLPLREIANI